MKIIVLDVPAEKSGALSVLEDFYNDVKEYKDKNIQWYFVLSKPQLCETENIKILRYPWIKKSWFHRLYFDYIIAPKIIKQYKPDKIFSLQNVIVPRTKVEQILYVHQALPFVNIKFDFGGNKIFWIYQNIISSFIFKSIKKASKVVVQTNWLKDACVEKTRVIPENIKVIPPIVNIKVKNHFISNKKNKTIFFYPAGASFYKNHRVIVEACEILKESKNSEYKVIFTLNGNENDYIKNLLVEVKEKQLPIEFIGNINREQVYDYYTKSVLVFPSYIESFGLPLLESKLHKGIILAANTPFAHEILDGYSNAYFFNTFNSKELANLIKRVIISDIKHFDNTDTEIGPDVPYSTLIDEILL